MIWFNNSPTAGHSTNGDIIRNYAICGLFLLLVYRLTAKQIIRMALFFSIIATTITFILYKAFDLERYQFDTTLFGKEFTVNSYLRYLYINWRTDTFTNFIQATPLTMLFCFGNMLMGFYLGKIGFFKNPQQFCSDAEIRLGISQADEKAKMEARRRKIEAPLSTDERIFFKK